MAKMTTKKQSLVGAVGALFIGAALVLYIVSIFFQALRDSGAVTGDIGTQTNESIDSLLSMLNVGIILFGILGITMIGGSILSYITGVFGG